MKKLAIAMLMAMIVGGGAVYADSQKPVVLTPTALYDLIEKQDARIKQLERKMKGVQKQITVLHSKKADK